MSSTVTLAVNPVELAVNTVRDLSRMDLEAWQHTGLLVIANIIEGHQQEYDGCGTKAMDQHLNTITRDLVRELETAREQRIADRRNRPIEPERTPREERAYDMWIDIGPHDNDEFYTEELVSDYENGDDLA